MAKKVLSGKDNTNGFQKNPQNINRSGANRKLVSSVIKELQEKGVEPATAPEIKDSYLRFLNLSEKELTEIAQDKEQPMLNRIVANSIIGNKGFEVIQQLLDRAIGKANQSIDHTSLGEQIQPTIIQLTKPKDE